MIRYNLYRVDVKWFRTLFAVFDALILGEDSHNAADAGLTGEGWGVALEILPELREAGLLRVETKASDRQRLRKTDGLIAVPLPRAYSNANRCNAPHGYPDRVDG